MRVAAAIVLGACGNAAHPVDHAVKTPVVTHVSQLADLAWLEGTWHSPTLDSHWQIVDGALYGIALNDAGFEVNVIDDSDEDGKPAPVTLLSLVNGTDPMRFALRKATPDVIELADAQQRVVRVVKTPTGWRGEFTDQPGRHPIVFVMQAGTLADGRALADADRAFGDDTAARGADGWVAHFADGGAMWRGGKRIEAAAMREAIAATLAKGQLRWTPIASGVRGDVGFTLGTYTFGSLHGSYATIWRKQSDGSWKVVFDIGRPGDR
jgi:ketosteroid isomerase-like protein